MQSAPDPWLCVNNWVTIVTTAENRLGLHVNIEVNSRVVWFCFPAMQNMLTPLLISDIIDKIVDDLCSYQVLHPCQNSTESRLQPYCDIWLLQS